ncbi:phosphatidylinositol kinase (PIK-E3) [Achlya hypogyna]|uniref:Phosphatidylinositol kinase (PIK-E3) n=1 Tax=Achlya hypogyna TaxID=1202772 RepID=A0A1V9Z835_ACHHY|nr:phosphatidylinositol kinase (PIK-E3) [Achlya hypogyna]
MSFAVVGEGDFGATNATIQAAWAKGVAPLPIMDCTGGAYFLRSTSQRLVAVFKPSDEEPFAVHAPKAAPTAVGPMRPGVPVGEMALRECVAYFADVDGFARVPRTVLVDAQHKGFHSDGPKRGSCQMYVAHDCSADDIGAALFPRDDVHAIALLDLRLVNQDRHAGNLLVQRREGNRLVPIDHGCTLPEYDAMGEAQFAWLFWPQSRQPLSAAAKAYVTRLNASKQLEAWQRAYPEVVFPAKAALTLYLGTVFVQTCVATGLTVHEMGLLVVRDDLSAPSQLERLVDATSRTLSGRDPTAHCSEFLGIFDRLLKKALRRCFPTYFSKTGARRSQYSMSPPPSVSTHRKASMKVLLSTAA